MAKDKYLHTFLKSNGGYCLYYPSNTFRNTGAKFASLSYVNHVKVFNWLPTSLNIHFETFEQT